MPCKHLSTLAVARAAGCHPNTVRRYEEMGFLPPIPRSPAGYRLFTRKHARQMVLARTAMNTPWPGRAIRRSAVALVKLAAVDWAAAGPAGEAHLALVRSELAHAEAAVTVLARWAMAGEIEHVPGEYGLRIREAARALDLTANTLRLWERDGLLDVPRRPDNRYREYGPPEMARLRVIRVLRSAGYSTMAILRMLSRLDSQDETRPVTEHDLRAALDTPPEDEDVFTAADRWLTTLHELEKVAVEMCRQLSAISSQRSA